MKLTKPLASGLDCIDNPATKGKVFELVNQGARPSEINWAVLFSSLG